MEKEITPEEMAVRRATGSYTPATALPPEILERMQQEVDVKNPPPREVYQTKK